MRPKGARYTLYGIVQLGKKGEDNDLLTYTVSNTAAEAIKKWKDNQPGVFGCAQCRWEEERKSKRLACRRLSCET